MNVNVKARANEQRIHEVAELVMRSVCCVWGSGKGGLGSKTGETPNYGFIKTES